MSQETQKWTSFDVVKGMLANLAVSDIPASIPRLHTALCQLQKQQAFARLLADYVFEDRSHFPFSRDFQTDLVNLEQSGHLSTSNPDFITYSIRQKLKTTFENYGKPLFTAEEGNLLKQMADEFEKALDLEPVSA
ncbi:MAG: hypothetical protein C0404_05605 [Verrucomicrobia bacterium]|nr:hypothetical protein [Verrucomicrobiota bacterium]